VPQVYVGSLNEVQFAVVTVVADIHIEKSLDAPIVDPSSLPSSFRISVFPHFGHLDIDALVICKPRQWNSIPIKRENEAQIIHSISGFRPRVFDVVYSLLDKRPPLF